MLNNVLHKSFGYQNIDGISKCLDKEIRRYDATANTWTLVKEPKGTYCTPTLFSANNEVYSGFDGVTPINKLNPTTLE